MSKISVIIPTYNRSSTIEYCLRSVLNQTFQDFEIIVADDCSTDNTIEIVKNISDPRIRYTVLKQKGGAQVARNEGIKMSASEWITFLDSDDEYLPDKLQLQFDALVSVNFNVYTVVHGNCNTIYHSKDETKYWNLPLVEGSTYSTLLKAPSPLFPSILTSKFMLELIGYLDEKTPSYQEWDTAILLAKHANFIHIQQPLFNYHLHHGDTISKNMVRDITGYQYIINKNKYEIINTCGIDTWNNHIKMQFQKLLKLDFMLVKNTFTKTDFELLNNLLLEYMNLNHYITDQASDYKRKYDLITQSRSFYIYRKLIKPFNILMKLIK